MPDAFQGQQRRTHPQVIDMMNECDTRKGNTCTGRRLCRHDPVYGESHEVFDELGYIAIPPCLWGSEEGLVPPTFLSFETNLLSIKRNNNTNAHYGDMAMWQMRGVMVKKEEEERKSER